MSHSNNNSRLLPYQKKWINDNSPLKIIEKSRQIGMSWTTAYGLVRDHATNTSGLDSWVSSRDHTQAKLFINDCARFAKTLNLATSSLNKPLLSNSNKPSSLSLTLANGTAIHSLSSNPNAQAGKRGSRVLDEFALHPNPKLLLSISLPGITWGGSLSIISTHRGSFNYFNTLIQNILHNGNPQKFSHHKVTLQDALDQGFLKKLQAKLPESDPRFHMDDSQFFDYTKDSCPDYPTFLQEYMCQPIDEKDSFLPSFTIDQNTLPSNSNWELTFEQIQKSPNNFFLGVDLARSHDLSVFYLLQFLPNSQSFATSKIITLQNTPFHIQEKTLHQFLKLPNILHTCIDQSGLGRQFSENAINTYGQHRVSGIQFTNYSKETLAFNLLRELENKKISIPNDPHLIADLRSIKRAQSNAATHIGAPHSPNGHGDRFWALTLALNAAQKSPPAHHYQPIPFHQKAFGF